MAATLSALSAAAAQRGQSAVEAVQRHAEGLQAALDAHTQALTQQQNKFARLREDFNYNLQLLRQRDVALQEAAEANRAAAEALEERERLLSEVSARLDEASQRERVQREGREEDARRHAEALQRLKDKSEEQLRATACEARGQRLKQEEETRGLQRKLRDAQLAREQERQLARAELEAAVEVACADMRAQLHAAEDAKVEAEARAQRAEREMELEKSRAQAAADAQGKAEAAAAEALRELKAAKWDLQDLQHAHALQLQTQAFEARQREASATADVRALQKRLAEAVQEKEEADARAAARLREAEIREEELQIRAEGALAHAAELEAAQAAREAADEAGGHASQHKLEILQKELEELRKETHVGRAARDAELVELRAAAQEHEREKMALVQELASVCRVVEMSRAGEAEAQAQARLAREGADASRARAEDTQLRRQYEAVQEEVQQCKRIIKKLQRERDAAMAASHAVALDEVRTSGSDEDQVNDDEAAHLRRQNKHLRDIVTKMREDMQALTARHEQTASAEAGDVAVGPLRHRLLELEQGIARTSAIAREHAQLARDLKGELELEQRRTASERQDAQERAAEAAALRRRMAELVRQADAADERAEKAALNHHRAALVARQETEALLAICVQHAMDCASLCGRLDDELGTSLAGDALRDLLENFRDQVALQRDRYTDGTAIEAQELALRQLLQERAIDRARAEGEVGRALDEQRRLDGDCRRLLDLSNSLRAKLAQVEDERDRLVQSQRNMLQPQRAGEPPAQSAHRQAQQFNERSGAQRNHAGEASHMSRAADGKVTQTAAPGRLPQQDQSAANPFTREADSASSQLMPKEVSGVQGQREAVVDKERAQPAMSIGGLAPGRHSETEGRVSFAGQKRREAEENVSGDADGDDGRPGTGFSLLSSISGLDESLAAVWRMVEGPSNQSADLALADTPLPPPEEGYGDLGVVGHRAPTQSRETTLLRPAPEPINALRPPSSGSRRRKQLRNYNVRDDDKAAKGP